MTVKGVILAAGYGTRFLPVTRCVPKEMLPLVDRPAIDLVVEELVGAGVRDLLVITSRRKRSLEDWFDRDPELEAVLSERGRTGLLDRIAPPDARVRFARQQEMRGTGHALLLAREFAGDAPLVVAYPDDLFGPPGATAELVETWERTGCAVLSAVDLAGRDVSRYGVLDVETGPDGHLRLRRIVEKPAPGTEPSTLVSLGRYLYLPEVFPLLQEGLDDHPGGEFYPMDAINALAARGRVAVRVVRSVRHDTGTPQGYLRTAVDLALDHPELGAPLRAWLEERLGPRHGRDTGS